MRKEMFWSGITMQSFNLVALAIIFVPWSLDLIIKVVLGSVFVLFNIASLLLIILGLILEDKR